MDKFKNEYRIQSYRMSLWDYAGNGLYFITLVTQNRKCNLGRIMNGEMTFSDFGKIVNDEWLQSFNIRNELILDEYIIMPNHLHAIVGLNKHGNKNNEYNSHDLRDFHVETHGRASLLNSGPIQHTEKMR